MRPRCDSRGWWLASVLAAWAWLPAQAADLPLLSWEGQTMGCTYLVKIVDARLTDQQVQAIKLEIDERLKEVNRQVSHYQPDSELSRFNRAEANTPFKVSPGLLAVLRHSLQLNHRSDGAFDPTLGPLINLWGFGEKAGAQSVPSEAQLREARKLTGCNHLTVTPSGKVIKDVHGLTLNLSSPAKGYGVDEMAAVLRGRGLTNFYVAIAGDLYTTGHNASGQPWQIGISAPMPHWRMGDPAVAVLSISGQAVSTSGDYQKYILDEKGRRLGHILNPKTGSPVQHNLGGVSVVADNCMTSSSLATTLFVLGPDEGMRFVETWTNAAALFVIREADGSFKSVPSSRFASMTGFKP